MHNQNIKQINKNLFKNIRHMRWLALLIISFTFGVGTLSANAEQALNFIDLNNWSPLGNGTWTVQTGGRTVTQSENGSPTFFLSPNEYSNVIVKGTIEVNTTSDDDFIGFVMGYENVGNEYEFVLFDWKQALQNEGKEGFNLAQINGNFSSGFDGNVFWDHDQTDSRYVELQSPPSNNDGWLDNTEYQFEILYTANQIRVKINGETIYNVTSGNFNAGQIGFYNYSQDGVIYGNVQAVDIDASSDNPSPSSDSYGVSSNSTLTVNASEGLFFNDYDPNLDDFEINSNTQPSNGALTLNSSDGSFTYTPNSSFVGTDTFTYSLIESNTSESLTSPAVTVTLNVISGANEAPSDIEFSRIINFTSFNNRTTVATLAAIDANDGDFHDFLLVDNNSGRFGINGSQITLADKTAVVGGNTYDITVRAEDFGGLSTDKVISLTLPFVIEYELHGGVNNNQNPEAFTTSSSSISLVSPSKIGYVFNGWFDESTGGNQVLTVDPQSSGNVTLHAQWTAISHDILYSLNGGNNPASNPSTFALDDNVIFFSNATKAGFVFDGWQLITDTQSYLTPAGLLSITPSTDSSITAAIHSYELYLGDYTWTEARDFCSNKGGYLSTVTSELEWNYILQKILQDSNPDDRYWLGAEAINKDSNANATEQNWQWLNHEGSVNLNETQGFENWASGEPNNSGGEYYLTTWGSQSWNDLPNSYAGMHGYVCEFDTTITFSGSITLNAIYIPNSYTISFNSNGGSSISPQTYETEALLNLTEPTKTGHTFEGWYLDIALSQSLSSDVMPAQNLTLYAKWALIEYPINYNVGTQGAITPSVATFTVEDSVTLESPMAISGYAFIGWYETDSFVSGTSITSISIGSTQAVTIYAKFTPIVYTITLDVDGGIAEDPIIEAFDTEIRLPAAKRPGYTLQGWYDGQERIPYNTRVKFGDRTYTARWNPNLYTLTMTNTADDETDTITAAYGSPIVVPIYRLEGYTFRGWFEGGTNVNFSSMPLGDRTIRAIMEPNPYTITFNTGEAPAIPALEAPYQSSIQLPNPTLENHTFDGWMLNGAIVNLTEMPLNGATLTASFTKLESTITFVNPEGNAPAPITTLIGDAVTLPTASKTGHTFDGWFLDGSQVSLTTMPELPITLTARFTINQYTLNVNGFNGQRINQITADYGESVTLPIPEQLGYLFAGWTLNGQAFSGNQVSMPAGGGTVNALFDPILYPVSWVYKDEIIQMRLPFESAIPLPASNVTGYAFEGWQENGTFIDSITVPLRGTTLTAIYRAYQTSQTFYLPGQTAQVTLTTDETFNGPTLNVPSHLVFGGYYTEPFGLGEALSPGDLIENGLDARSYPHVYNPASTYQVPSGETLFTGTIRSSSNTTEPGTPSMTSEIPWLSMVIWGSGILTLVILSERGRRRG